MRKQRDTEEVVKQLRSYGPICSPGQLAKAVGGNAYRYNVQARNGRLPYDFYWSGRVLRIYTESVIKKITAGGCGNDQV